jgi:hypothetical protein
LHVSGCLAQLETPPPLSAVGLATLSIKPAAHEHPHKSEINMSKIEQVRRLNDEFRRTFSGGHALITPGIAAFGQQFVERLVKTIALFDDFHHANDLHEEHDFGCFDVDGNQIIFKIDYYDSTLTYHSPDPTDPAVTRRVITVMLANEY